MIPLLAEADSLSIGQVVQSLSAIALLAAVLIQIFRGGSQRQIEPTEMHAITTELKAQTLTLNKLDREMGSVQTTVISIEKQMDGMHHRVGSISRDLASTTARVDGMERRENNREGKPRA